MELNSVTLCCYSVLCQFANDDGIIPANALSSAASIFGCSTQTVRRAVRKLIAARLLERNGQRKGYRLRRER